MLARQPGVAKRWQQHLIASPFGTIHAAMFSLPRPVGTAIPHPPIYALANFDPADITGSIGKQPLGDETAPAAVSKSQPQGKGRLTDLAAARTLAAFAARGRNRAGAGDRSRCVVEEERNGTGRFDPYSQYEFVTAPDEKIDDARCRFALCRYSASQSDAHRAPECHRQGGGAAFLSELIRWRVAGSRSRLGHRVKRQSCWPRMATLISNSQRLRLRRMATPRVAKVSPTKVRSPASTSGLDSPAERLALAGAARAKAEKCLANAVYFEARGESVRGQIAVAQVVMNRVFSPFYPNDVCGVVYQNAHRHLACQFTFACDGIPDIVTEPDAWERAKRIARDMLDGKLWMPEVSKSTHYHAYWVHPDWVNEMKKVYKLGVHTFYRPRAWGDGEDEPTWGDAAATEKEAADEEAKGPVSHSLEWLRSEEGQASAPAERTQIATWRRAMRGANARDHEYSFLAGSPLTLYVPRAFAPESS